MCRSQTSAVALAPDRPPLELKLALEPLQRQPLEPLKLALEPLKLALLEPEQASDEDCEAKAQ